MRIAVLSLFVVCMLCMGSVQLQAQDNVRVSVNNVVNYGSGTESDNMGETKNDTEYFENFTDVRINADNVIIGFRLEFSDPAEYGPDFSGLRRRFIGFRRNGLDVRVGDLFALHNRGLSLNLFEDRVIRYDTSLEGVRAEYENDWFRVKALAGSVNYLEHLTFDNPGGIREENYRIRSAAADFSPLNFLRIGGSYTYAEGELPLFGTEIDTVKVFLPEVFATVRTPWARINAGYNHRSLTMNSVADSVSGSGFYGAVSHTGRGYGVTLEYKNYSYDVVPHSVKNLDPLRNTRMSPFQSPPIAHKEHSYSLMTRDPHLVNFNDEVGFFLESFYSPMPSLTLNASLAMASVKYAWQKDLDPETFELMASRRNIGPNWLPSLNEERDPFWEIYADIDFLLPDFISYVKAGYNHRNRTFYTYNPFPGTFDLRNDVISNTFFVDIQYAFTPVWSVKLISEHRFVSDDLNVLNEADPQVQSKSYYDQLLTFQVTRSPSLTVGARIETTTDDTDPSGQKLWYTFEGSMRIGNTHTIMGSVGKERGGFVCTNGVCRFVNAFEGVRLSFISTF